jgi:D-galactose 1-dehydrogenase
MTLAAGAATLHCDLDFRETGAEQWTIELATDAGLLTLTDGGAKLAIDGETMPVPSHAEYAGLYRRFAALIAAGRSDVDLRPLELVADAFLIGSRRSVAAFDFQG